jgi:hypothetical protein
MELSFLSPGYPMYFQLLLFSMYICLVFLVGSGLYNIFSNYYGNSCYGLSDIPRPIPPDFLIKECLKDSVNRLSMANKRFNDFSMDTQEIFNLLTVIILIGLLQILRKTQKETALVCDEREITASDFTARAIGFPTEFPDGTDIDEEIKLWFTVNGLPGTTLNIQRVNLCYDCEEKLDLKDEVEELTGEKYKINREEEGAVEKLNKIEGDIKEKTERINQINTEFATGVTKAFVGEAYITFESQQELKAVVKHWKLDHLAKISESMNKNSKFKYNGHMLKVIQATEPSDILWENAGFTHKNKLNRRLFTLFGTFLVLLVSFWVLYFTKSYKVNFTFLLSL